MPPPRHIAVLGGGITGLSSAFHLSRRFPTAQITLVEKQKRLGGWIRSERLPCLPNGGSVVLEAGPRTLRPVDKSILELIHLLGLSKDLITTPKTSSAARNRFLHVPELGRGLHVIPSTPLAFASSNAWPLTRVLLPAVLGEPFRRWNRPLPSHPFLSGSAKGNQKYTDESVDSFLTRRFGEAFARVFGSALVHGIYAADSRSLSVRAAFPSLWEAEEAGGGSVLLGFLRKSRRQAANSGSDGEGYKIGDVAEKMKNVSVFSFRDGMETLPKALEVYLEKQENVHIVRGRSVTGLSRKHGDEAFELKLDDSNNVGSSSPPLTVTHIASALPLPTLHRILLSSPSSSTLPYLTTNPMSTVTVINLVFACPPSAIHPAGFGYLIPRAAAPSPSVQRTELGKNHLHLLGTVFDSCSLAEQDSSPGTTTKLTVMLKGEAPHHDDVDMVSPSMDPSTSRPSPSVPRLIARVLTTLVHHLSLPAGTLPDPVYWKVHVNRGCIPTYLPGHKQQMEELQRVLTEEGKGIGWEGRLQVVGAGVGGVSVGDCVGAGKRVGEGWR
ncbi:hypothetical protein AMATHDRAFT_49748 [Amanita thiersii Skay4041]|uniref:Protoporphyrinogen oxidase n=1 Tax=Amanita thiersii Skay4041 TaxID=703135 RepID=A0A2A9NK45_9AGAR|nr:hypothetical protein AMATHDRAFT_49748 [Amanita thiersii Skay4041]